MTTCTVLPKTHLRKLSEKILHCRYELRGKIWAIEQDGCFKILWYFSGYSATFWDFIYLTKKMGTLLDYVC